MKCSLCEFTADTEVEIGLHLADDHGMLASEARKKAAEIAGRPVPTAKGATMTRGKKGTATAGRCSYCKRSMDGPHAPACRPAVTNNWPRAVGQQKAPTSVAPPTASPGIKAWLDGQLQAARVRVQVLEAIHRELP